ncbi:MAG: SDR family NAD(P)-dependent oxidoreductase [Balneolaceae bacterium]|nr:MAG: SDR family NAD(P)-dependent oxidoreductase [Balneolaceae bacterium]
MQEIIITGASRGFGRHVAIQLAGPGRHLHLINRSKPDATASEIRDRGGDVSTWSIDLTLTERLEDSFLPVLDSVKSRNPEAIGLINNAGTIEPVGPLGKYETSGYRKHLELNYVAPALLTHLFVKHFQQLPITKRILFVGSGASRRPIHGWSHYCSSKAAIDMLAKTVALEQDAQEYPFETAVFNPGRIETDMQEALRDKSKEDFPLVDDFVASATDGRNLPPEQVAEKMVRIFLSDTFPHGEIVGR